MTKKEKIKRIIVSVIFWTLTIISFLFFASLVILKANGIQLNWKSLELSKTGMIILSGEPRDVELKVNQKYLTGLPEAISNLTPGNYNVTITKEGYISWQKNIVVLSGQATGDENIILFLKDPIEITTPENYTSDKIVSDFQKKSVNITLNDTEVYLDEILITRFNSRVVSATSYTDNRHIVYQINNEIKVMDLNGQNQVTLTTLTSQEPATWTFKDNGKTFVYLDNGEVFSRTIR